MEEMDYTPKQMLVSMFQMWYIDKDEFVMLLKKDNLTYEDLDNYSHKP